MVLYWYNNLSTNIIYVYISPKAYYLDGNIIENLLLRVFSADLLPGLIAYKRLIKDPNDSENYFNIIGRYRGNNNY